MKKLSRRVSVYEQHHKNGVMSRIVCCTLLLNNDNNNNKNEELQHHINVFKYVKKKRIRIKHESV